MSAPLYLHESDGLADLAPGDRFELGGEEGRHAGVVKRSRAGEIVEVSDGAGLRVSCVVIGLVGDRLELEVRSIAHEPPPALRFVLAQALAKGDRDEMAIEAATELGVDRVIPWQAERSIVVWRGPRAAKSYWRWQATVRAATKQSRRVYLPQVDQPRSTADLAAEVARITAAGGACLVLHEAAAVPLARTPLPSKGEVLLAVGPEGGISDGELARLVGAGAIAVRLGDSVLRTSTAGPAALAALSLVTGRWGPQS